MDYLLSSDSYNSISVNYLSVVQIILVINRFTNDASTEIELAKEKTLAAEVAACCYP